MPLLREYLVRIVVGIYWRDYVLRKGKEKKKEEKFKDLCGSQD
jgi:hypothetical protein